jgi:hypothetical protein
MLGRTTEAEAGWEPGNGGEVVDNICSDTEEIDYFACANPAPPSGGGGFSTIGS